MNSVTEQIKRFFSKRYKMPKTDALENARAAFSPIEKIIFTILSGIFIISALILLYGVSQKYMVEIPKQGGTLTEGIVGTPHFINPLFATTDGEEDLSSLIYSGLMKFNSDGTLVPDLAQSYSISPDGRTYTFILKNNIYFQDGTPVTADDVAFTIAEASDPSLKSPRQAQWDGVKVTELSPKEIQFTLSQPFAPFLENTTLGILPKHVWQNIDDDEFSQFNNLIGSGPYKFSNATLDSDGVPTSYTLSAFNDYVSGAPYIQTLVFKFYATDEMAIAAYKAGDIQSLGSVSPEEVASIINPDSVVRAVPLPRLFGVFFNQSQAPVFANKEVRQALSMVVDRNSIIDQVLDGYGVPLTEPVPASTLNAIENATASSTATSTAASTASATQTSAHSAATTQTSANSASIANISGLQTSITIPAVPAIDVFGATTTVLNADQQAVSAAKTVLAKNGWLYNQTDGVLEKTVNKKIVKLSFSIYTANTPELVETADILQQEWSALGAQVDVKSFELGDLTESVIRPRQYDVLLFGEVLDQDTDLYPFWDSSQREDPGLNVAMYANSKVDKVVEQLRGTTDPATRAQLFQSFITQFNADIPAIFIYSPDFIYVQPKAVQNVEIEQMNGPSDRFATINQWYIETQDIWKIFEGTFGGR